MTIQGIWLDTPPPRNSVARFDQGDPNSPCSKWLKMLDLRETPDGLLVAVKVQPGARRVGIGGLHGDRLKIALSAPAVDGKANRALVEFLAGLAGIAQSAVGVVRGEKSREKVVRLAGVSRASFEELLKSAGITIPCTETETAQPTKKAKR